MLNSLIWATPLREMLKELRTEAATLRKHHDAEGAATLERFAKRLESQIEAAAQPGYATPDEVARVLGITPAGVRAACRRKKLPARKIAGQWRVPLHAL